MESQRKESRPGWYHASLLLAAALVLPGLSLDTLLCNHCHMQHKAKSCSNVSTTRCLADERCSTSRGRFGRLHVLSAQGCLAAVLCGTHEFRAYQGMRFNVSYACCCKERCNRRPEPETSLKTLLGLIAHKADSHDVGRLTKNVVAEEPWDSCVNYTSSRGSTGAVVMNVLSG